MSYDSEVLADTPLAYWRMDDASGALADSSGNGRSLPVAQGSAIYRQSGGLTAGGYSIGFTGSQSFGQGAPAWAQGYAALTFEAWVWFTANDSSKPVFFAYDNVATGLGSNRVGFLFNYQGRLGFHYYFNDSESEPTTSGMYNDGQWHHAVGVFKAGLQALYVDGRLVASATDSRGPQSGSGGYLAIGGNSNNSAGNYHNVNGALDEVALYGTALSADRVAAHYTAGTSAPAPVYATPRVPILRAATR